jgi:hypothetical protein
LDDNEEVTVIAKRHLTDIFEEENKKNRTTEKRVSDRFTLIDLE